MSFWDSLGSLFKGGGKPAAARDTSRTYILDGERMLEGRGGSAGPLERFQLLQRMAQFAERESIKLQIVYAGRPLREVANGETFKGVQVYFVEQPSGVLDQLDKLARRAGRNALVVTSDAQTEARIRDLGGMTMRASTLRKGLEGNAEGGGGDDRRDRQRRPRHQRGGRRPDNRPDDRQQQQQRADESEGGGNQPQESSNPSVDTTVKNLIDLVE